LTKKEIIIATAQDLFAKHGYAATSIDDIAKPCGVTKAAIYYHFQDKNELYEYILEKNIKVLADKIEENIGKEESVEKKLYSYILSFANELEKNKTVASMLMREMSNGGESMPTNALVQMLRTFKMLTSIIEAGVEKKVFQCMEPVLIQMMVVGSLTFLINTQNIRHKIKQELDPKAKTVVEFTTLQAAQKIANMVLNSLKYGDK
jgi:AcrR family transcriptional regulator